VHGIITRNMKSRVSSRIGRDQKRNEKRGAEGSRKEYSRTKQDNSDCDDETSGRVPRGAQNIVCNASPSGLTGATFDEPDTERYEFKVTYVVLSKRETNPVVPVPMSPLFDRLNISLLLEHLSVLGHILCGLKRVKVSDIGISVKYRDEGCRSFTEAGEWERGEERE
jgi:hypothetical protein